MHELAGLPARIGGEWTNQERANAPKGAPLGHAVSWRQRAACNRAASPDAWFPDDPDDPAARFARATCQACPTREECLEEGYVGRLPNGEPLEGIWGGLSELERALLRLHGWQPGQPLPAPLAATTPEWVPVSQAARAAGVSREAIYLWLRQEELDTRQAEGPNGEPWRLVRLDQVHARAARARPRKAAA